MNDDNHSVIASNESEIARQGGIAAVVKALDNHPTSIAMKEHAYDNRMEIAREGGIAVLVKALSSRRRRSGEGLQGV